MDKLKKEFIFNVCLFSFLLSVLYSFFLVYVENPLVANYDEVSDPGNSVVFILFFLILYAVHVIFSIIFFVVARIVGTALTKRMIVSNGIAIVLIGLISFITKQEVILFLIISLAVFSTFSVIFARKDSYN